MPDSCLVCVDGDVDVDQRLLAYSKDTTWTNGQEDDAYSEEAGGAALLTRLLAKLRGAGSEFSLKGIEVSISKGVHLLSRSNSTWEFVRPEKGRGGKGAWRMRENFMRYIRPKESCEPRPAGVKVFFEPSDEPSILAIVDDDLGYRDSSQYERWLGGNEWRGDVKPWVILKLRKPKTENNHLWQKLLACHKERLVVVVTANDVRHSEVNLSRSLSWERTAEDLMHELANRPSIEELREGAYLIVSLPPSGAFLLPGKATEKARKEESKKLSRWLFYDPTIVEGGWEQQYPGRVLGYSTCLTAGICYAMVPRPSDAQEAEEKLKDGIMRGLTAMRELHQEGYEYDPNNEAIKFPIVTVAEALKDCKNGNSADPIKQKPVFYKVELPDDIDSSSKRWLILDHYRQDPPRQRERRPDQKDPDVTPNRPSGDSELWPLAKDIALWGIETILPGVPRVTYGDLTVIDRGEIEGYQSIRKLIEEYCRSPKRDRPLSIAVFGPPGTGKSFGIREIACATRPTETEFLKFNVSQFSSPDELPTVFKRVRDIALQGKLGIVFWDEFDTNLNGRGFGWLRYFLGPMNDGQYEDQIGAHSIGPCIFVFAGSTCDTVEEFLEACKDVKNAKGVDFASRLLGKMNMAGVNAKDEDDLNYVIRRAVLIRGLLQSRHPQLFRKTEQGEELQIHDGVLRALLTVPEYKYNVRSIKSIFSMCRLAGEKRFLQSAVPDEKQLDLHVDGEMFRKLVAIDKQSENSMTLRDKCPRRRAWKCQRAPGRPCFLLQPTCYRYFSLQGTKNARGRV